MKKDGVYQRKIIQCMCWNSIARGVEEFMGEPVDYGLLGIAAVAQAETTQEEIDAFSLDVGNAFTYVVTPSD